MAKAKTPYSIAWKPLAEADLDSIVDYIVQNSPALAVEFGQELRDKTSRLAQHPLAGRTGRPGMPTGVRELVIHRNYVMFYRVRDNVRTVEVLQLKHAAQQMPSP